MLKTITGLEYKVADKIFHFICDADATTEAIKEALCQWMAYVTQIENAQKVQAQEIKTVVPPKEPLDG